MANQEKKNGIHSNIPDTSLFLLKNIITKINIRSIKLDSFDSSFCISMVVPDTFSYCHESIMAVQRSFKPLGWKCQMTHYERREDKKDKKVMHGYIFTFSKNKQTKIELPF